MPGSLLYSANPWIAHEIAMIYRSGVHFAWVSEYFDSKTALHGTGASAIAPSSNPKRIYYQLHYDVAQEDTHSALIKGYRRTFRNLASTWYSKGEITEDQKNEICSVLVSSSWKMWRPVLYVIPRDLILPANRIVAVPHKRRAAYGPELQISDLKSGEFDCLELTE